MGDSRKPTRRAVRRPERYPLWGMEARPRACNALSLYRGGERGVLSRYIVGPREGSRLMAPGLTVGDLAASLVAGSLAALAFLALAWAMGAGVDGYLAAMGW